MNTRLIAPIIGLFALSSFGAGYKGAIFTTTPDGEVVNENVHYADKTYVYLDGGPGPNAPQTAAGLPDGCYVFQVTDPPGKVLLSEDPAKCRVVEVNEGVITAWVNPTTFLNECGVANLTFTYGNNIPCQIQNSPDGAAGTSGRHDTNTDADHGPPAIVVQLMPFYDTPNPGGVYKAWVTPIEAYLANGGNLSAIPQDLKVRGKKVGYQPDPAFGPARDEVKTDNFKVKKAPFIAPVISVKKFHDKNANGIFDGNDEWVTGWAVTVTDPGATNTVYTPKVLVAEPAGLWSFNEDNPTGVLQTASYLDGLATIPFPTDPVNVTVAGTSGETHEVIFGNTALGKVKACKEYASDESPIVGWRIQLSKNIGGVLTLLGTQSTGQDGCTTFGNLLPGSYRVSEVFPLESNWSSVGPTYYDFTVVSTLSGSVITGSSFNFTFVNFCTTTAAFFTKGFWHNQNGLTILTTADRDYANSLDPYDSPTDYFATGDEPFNGLYSNGTPVPAAQINSDPDWAQGTWKAEVSNFLVDNNGGGTIQEQLAQQLLAIIFNIRHTAGLGGNYLVNGTWMTGSDLIATAIAAWQTPGTDDDKVWEPILDGLNNNSAVPVSSSSACTFTYPTF